MSRQTRSKRAGKAELEPPRTQDPSKAVLESLASMKGHAQEGTDNTATPLDLKMTLTNFGSVRKGTVRFAPLTIFVGPANSGKSYVSVLAHSIFSAHPHNRVMLDGVGTNFDVQMTDGAKMYLSPKMVGKVRDDLIQHFGRNIQERLSYNFQSDPESLVRRGSAARITISDGSAPDNEIGITIRKNVTVRPKTADNKFEGKPFDNISLHATSRMIYDSVGSVVLPRLPRSHYLPAARSGILQTYRTLAASVVSAPRSTDAYSPSHTLTGMMADFVSAVLTLPDREGKLAGIARQMDSDLFGGSIDVTFSAYGLPEITYSSAGHRLPLYRASAAVSEVAPLSVYLKHVVAPGDLLIIEEPEANMHPENQAKVAASIVRMIRAGLNVLLTTHSAYLVGRLGQYVVAGTLNPKTRAKHASYKNEYLLPGEVSPYVFSKSKDGYRINEIEKTREDGISQEEFIPVLDEFSDEAVMLYKNLEEEPC